MMIQSFRPQTDVGVGGLMRRLASGLVLGLIIGSQPVAAQEVGDRVRVTVADGVVNAGRISTVTSDGLGLVLDGRSRYFMRDEIYLLERARTKSAWKRGLLIGGGSGFLLAFFSHYGDEYCSRTEPVRGPKSASPVVVVGIPPSCVERKTRGFSGAMGFALGGAVAGAAIGAGVGALIRSETWESIAIDGPEATVAPIVDLHLNRNSTTAIMLGLRVRW